MRRAAALLGSRSRKLVTGGRRAVGCRHLASDRAADTVTVDTSGLIQPHKHANAPTRPPPPLTELAKELSLLIRMRGPIPVADFMGQALQHPIHGYYMRDVPKIGRQGDFVTAPEISQVFGELIGVWCVATWDAMGRPPQFRLVELGPGKGTLMQDLLRAATAFPDFRAAATVHLVETSEAFRREQRRALAAEGVPQTDLVGNCEMRLPAAGGRSGGSVHWHRSLSQVPAGPLLLVAQELLDALPVHQFVLTERGWSERMVDIADADSDVPFRFTVAPNMTPAVRALLQPSQGPGSAPAKSDAKVGDGIEVCPLAMAAAQDIGERVARDGGGALLIDYGEGHAQSDSLRAFKGHKEVPLLAEPGLADVTCDVDFGAVKRMAAKVQGAVVAGPIPQGLWLQRMGIQQRVAALMEQDTVTDDQAEAMLLSFKRLVDPAQMGAKYKALAITDARQAFPPHGFA